MPHSARGRPVEGGEAMSLPQTYKDAKFVEVAQALRETRDALGDFRSAVWRMETLTTASNGLRREQILGPAWRRANRALDRAGQAMRGMPVTLLEDAFAGEPPYRPENDGPQDFATDKRLIDLHRRNAELCGGSRRLLCALTALWSEDGADDPDATLKEALEAEAALAELVPPEEGEHGSQ